MYVISSQIIYSKINFLIILKIFGGFYNIFFSILKLNRNERSKFKKYKSTL